MTHSTPPTNATHPTHGPDDHAAHSRTIVIVGGVAGGASAATRARRVNEHVRIVLFEKDQYISFANCGLPYYIGGEIKDREKLLVASPELLRRRFKIDVHTRCEVTGIDRRRKVVTVVNHETGETFEQPYDKLILSPGASPIMPPTAATQDGPPPVNVFSLRNVADTDAIRGYLDVRQPRHAVVVGGGFIGLEMVEMLRHRGLDVTLIELQPQVLPPLDPEMAQIVEAELRRHEVDLRLRTGLADLALAGQEAGTRAKAVVLDDGSRLATDMVIMAIGVRPNTKLAEDANLTLGPTRGIAVNDHGQTSDADIYAVGDAAEYGHGVLNQRMRVPLAGPANRSGRLAGEHAARAVNAADASPTSVPTVPTVPSVLGTAIVRVFNVTAGVTGLSEKQADRYAGGPMRCLYVAGNHHVGYYPGAEQMWIKLLHDGESGRVLGAQIVGGAGVDKRLDVLATTIHFGGTVDDLTQLDLAYAPPFGAAKDPIHMAGFAAANEHRGMVRFVPPGADLAGTQVIDMRTDPEVAKMPLAAADHAVHIPLDDLRDRLSELDAERPTVTVCASGLRSYVGARILMQHGFRDVADLSGGAMMRSRAIGAGTAATGAHAK